MGGRGEGKRGMHCRSDLTSNFRSDSLLSDHVDVHRLCGVIE